MTMARKEKGLLLSPKHGLNPTVPVCFWCGKPKNEIALLGRFKTECDNDAEAPRHMILDYDPCEACKAEWDKCVIVAAVTAKPMNPGQPAVKINDGGTARDAYPTGQYVGITAEAAGRLFGIVSAKPGMVVTIDSGTFDTIFSGVNAKDDSGMEQ